jgi:hypothetical protein
MNYLVYVDISGHLDWPRYSVNRTMSNLKLAQWFCKAWVLCTAPSKSWFSSHSVVGATAVLLHLYLDILNRYYFIVFDQSVVIPLIVCVSLIIYTSQTRKCAM